MHMPGVNLAIQSESLGARAFRPSQCKKHILIITAFLLLVHNAIVPLSRYLPL